VSATLVATKLREPEPERRVDLVRAHEMLMGFARYTLSRRRPKVQQSRERLEDLAVEVADDALLVCLEMLRRPEGVPTVMLPGLVSASVSSAFARRGWTKHELLAGREVADVADALAGRGARCGGRADEQEVLAALLRGVPRRPTWSEA
jgi:hypothetical protein